MVDCRECRHFDIETSFCKGNGFRETNIKHGDCSVFDKMTYCERCVYRGAWLNGEFIYCTFSPKQIKDGKPGNCSDFKQKESFDVKMTEVKKSCSTCKHHDDKDATCYDRVGICALYNKWEESDAHCYKCSHFNGENEQCRDNVTSIATYLDEACGDFEFNERDCQTCKWHSFHTTEPCPKNCGDTTGHAAWEEWAESEAKKDKMRKTCRECYHYHNDRVTCTHPNEYYMEQGWAEKCVGHVLKAEFLKKPKLEKYEGHSVYEDAERNSTYTTPKPRPPKSKADEIAEYKENHKKEIVRRKELIISALPTNEDFRVRRNYDSNKINPEFLEFLKLSKEQLKFVKRWKIYRYGGSPVKYKKKKIHKYGVDVWKKIEPILQIMLSRQLDYLLYLSKRKYCSLTNCFKKPKKNICPDCSTKNKKQAKFCCSCGKRL